MHSAILIEDEDDDAERVQTVLREAGFSVISRFADASSAIIGCTARSDLVDLVIVDRRLPQEPRDEPLDAVGDDLLEAILAQMSDSLLVVFTAHGDTDHAENATAERGTIDIDEDHRFDRVRHFQKANYRGFEEYVQRISQALNNLNSIDVDGVPGSEMVNVATRRLLRKLAVLDRGRAVVASQLDGGLTRRAVYNVRVLDEAGALCSRRVVKIGPVRKRSESGGYPTLLDAPLVAAPVNKVVGLCAGLQAQVLQLAGGHPVTLFSILKEAPGDAVSVLREVIRSTGMLHSVERAVAVRQMYVFANEAEVRILCSSLGFPPFIEGLTARSKMGAQHGDLHAGNILVVNGSPVLIDFDNTMHSSIVVDALTMLLSSMFHSSSPFRAKIWLEPSDQVDIFDPSFLEGCPAPDWFSAVIDWVLSNKTSDREVAALVLSYVARQLKFPDFPSSGPLHEVALGLARRAANELLLV